MLHEGLDAIDTAAVDRALGAWPATSSSPHPSAAPEAAVDGAAGPVNPDKEEQAEQVLAALDELAGMDDWAPLATQLRHVVAGHPSIERDALDEIDTAILATVLRRLGAPR